MAAASPPGPLGTQGNQPVVDRGTAARAAMPAPAAPPPAAAAPAEQNDPAIEALDLAPTARKAAYSLKSAHPAIAFTSGRRSKADQARAMAGNVVKNRKWIEQTYLDSPLRKRCQDWVDANAGKTKAEEIAAGLLSVFEASTDAELGAFSKHLSGAAFDVQPVDQDAEEIKKTIRGLAGLDKFLDMEGGLVRWHAQF